ncbi:MAG: FMN-binding protein [Massiliimalia sp.]|jgi:electron transport complex protein RnfG
MEKWKSIGVPTLVLTVISCLIAALLAVTYNVTGIANLGTGLSEDELKEYAPVLENCQQLTQAEYESEQKDLLGVYVNEDKTQFAMHIQTAGYAGKSKPIEALVGFDQDGTIVNVMIVSCQETPGLGTKIEDAEYLKGYQGVSGSADGVDTITGATISSKALRNGVNFALGMFEEVKGEVLA